VPSGGGEDKAGPSKVSRSAIMRVRVEMLGLSRLVTGTREVSLEMPDEATYRDLVYTLSETYPGLVGNVILMSISAGG